jgi:O-antigen ligase
VTNKTALIEKKINFFWINFVLTVIALAAPWFGHYISDHELIKSTFSFLGFGFLVLITLYFKTINADLTFSINYFKLSLLILFLFGTLSIFWSTNIDFTINKWLLWLTALFGFLVANNLANKTATLIKLSWGLLIAGGFIALVGILQHLFDPFLLTQYAAPASTFANRNIATQPLILILPVFLFLFFSERTQNIQAWLLSIITSLILSYIFYSISRGAWISIFIQSFLIIAYLCHYKFNKYSWISWNKNKTYATIFGLILTLTLCSLTSQGFIDILDLSTQEFNSITDSIEYYDNDAVAESNVESWRYEIWKTAIDMVQASPLIGTGLGTFSHNLANEGYATWLINNTFRVHNDALELLVEIGAIGGVIFIIVIILALFCIINILKNNKGEINLFYYLIFVMMAGSFFNLQFSFPYQMPFPVLIFGFYCGLISNKFDASNSPILKIQISLSKLSKKVGLIFFGFLLILSFYFTYFSWIKVNHQLNKDNLVGDFSQINIVDTRIYNSRMQNNLYVLGGNYFNKGRYIQSNAIDAQFLKFWPNHLDVIFRYAYSLHKLDQNNEALELSKKLKKLEPKGLYNSFIVDMFVYSSMNETNKLEKTFNELMSQPEVFLRLNDDTYRFLVFFSLESANLSKNTIDLYNKYVKYHGYNCEVTNNMAIYFFNKEDFKSSAEYVELAYKKSEKNEPKCLNPNLIRLLKQKKLINH